jgi:phage terminase Nu1 subunit (DNA packaging protein)
MSYWTKSALARDSGLTIYQVEKLLGLGLPHVVSGQGRSAELRIDKRAALAWFGAFALDARADPESTPDFTRQKTRLAKEQADKVALENATARGELLPAAEVAKADEIIFTALRDRVMQVESAAPLLCDAALKDGERAMRPLLRSALRDALEDVGSAELVEAPAP